MIVQSLVRCYLLCLSSEVRARIELAILSIVEQEQVCFCKFFRAGCSLSIVVDSRPAEEGVTLTGTCAFDIDCFVYFQVVFGNGLIAAGIVIVPEDVRRSGHFSRAVLGHQSDRVGELGVLFRAAFQLFDAGISLQNCECLTGIDDNAAGYIISCSFVPLLYIPIEESQRIVCRSRSILCDRSCGILVEERILDIAGTAIQIVLDADAFGADQDRAPLGIEIQSRGDPETVYGWRIGIIIVIIFISVRVTRIFTDHPVFIHRVGLSRCFIIRGLDARIVRHEVFLVEDCLASLIKEPTHHLVLTSLNDTGRYTDFFSRTYTEAHAHVIITPVQISLSRCRICRNIRHLRMQEDTILVLYPLCVDGDAAFRQSVKVVKDRAGFVYKPSCEGITGISRLYSIFIFGDVCAISNTGNRFMQLALITFICYRIEITIEV